MTTKQIERAITVAACSIQRQAQRDSTATTAPARELATKKEIVLQPPSLLLPLYSMRQHLLVVGAFAVALAVAQLAAPVSQIVGVRPELQLAYQPVVLDGEHRWSCLSDPSIVLSYDQINDDYCDCPDGSDEPGTNACKNDSTTFYCQNDGHIPGELPRFKLNDGVCDYDVCCDGTDEYFRGGCPNKCAQVSAQYEHFRQTASSELLKALVAKAQLEAEGTRLQQEAAQAHAALSSEIAALEHEISALRDETAQHGSNEADEENDDSSDAPLQQSVAKVSRLLLAQQDRLSAQRESVAKLESLLFHLIENYNPNFNDAAVKEAVRGFQDYVSNKEEGGDSGDDSGEASAVLEELTANVQQNHQNHHQNQNQNQKLQYIDYKPSWRNAVHHYYTQLLDTIFDAEPAHNSPGLEQPPRVSKKLETKMADFESKLNDKKQALERVDTDLSNDYGPHSLLRAVKSTWVTNDLNDYTYSFGFFESIFQKKNGENTQIGTFKGVEEGNVMVYADGAKCWNGPRRSAKVQLVCGEESKLLSVHEPEKCEYYFELQTPIVCQQKSEAELMQGFKVDLSLL